MAYIRAKVIKGHTYYYLVRGERHGDKVRQKVVKYLGKHPPAAYVEKYGLPGDSSKKAASDAGNAGDLEFAPVRNMKGEGAQGFLLEWAKRLGANVQWDETLGRKYGANGAYNLRSRTIVYDTRDGHPQLYTIAHEIGHLIDYHVLDRASGSDEFGELKAELNAFTEHRLSLSGTGGARPTLENLRRYYERVDSERTQRKLRERIQFIELRIEGYFCSEREQFADLFACCLLEPRKTKAQAPNAYAYMVELFQSHPKLAQFMEALNTHRRLDK